MEKEENVEGTLIKRNWWLICLPFIIAVLLSVILIITAFIQLESSAGYSLIAFYILFPAIFILLMADVGIKSMAKRNTALVWLIEAVLLLLSFLFL